MHFLYFQSKGTVYMIVLLCVDKKNGMAFHQRRQSLDRAVRADILSMSAGKPIWMTSYSARQFIEPESVLQISESPLCGAGEGALCFVEFPPLAPSLDRIEELMLYRWDRVYPADQQLDLDLDTDFRLVSTCDLTGHSHDKITKEVYQR